LNHISHFIVDLALILVTAGVVTVIFKKINQPVALGYILAGFLISPNFLLLPTATDIENIDLWADIGIIFLMFALGLEFSFHNIAKVGGSAIITALVVMGSMITVGYGVGSALGWSTMDSVFLGSMLSMSSTMIIMKAYDEMNLKSHPFAQLTLGALVIEDIVGVFMMIILTAVSVSQGVSGGALAGEIGMMLLVLVVILCVGIYVVPTLLNKVKEDVNDEILMIVSLGFCFLMVVICINAGFSEALGAFLAGSILAGTSLGERIEHLVKPLKDLFGAVFFVSVGMLIEPDMLLKYWAQILLISVITVIGQMTFSSIGALLSGQPFETAVRTGFSMVQVGEFSFIIASLGSSLGVTSDFLYPIVVCVSVITIFTTPIFIKSGEKVSKKLYLKMPNKFRAFLANHTSDNQAEHEREGDWSGYLKRYFIKLLIGTSLLLAIYTLSQTYVNPTLSLYIENDIIANVITVVIAFAAMIPVINMMCTKRSILFNKLWLKSRANILPLLTLRSASIAVATLFIVLTINNVFMYIKIPAYISIPVAFVIVVFSMRSGFIKGRSAQLQATFLANFNQKILDNAKKERGNQDTVWVDDILYVFRFRITKIYKRKQVKDFIASRVYGIKFIDIIHEDGTHLHMPKALDKIQEEDLIFGLGTKEHIEAYMMFLDKADYAIIDDHGMITLKEYIDLQQAHNIPIQNRLFTAAIPITKDSEFNKTAIVDSGFVNNYNGIIIGVERNLLPIATPGKDFVIMENDIMMVLGAQSMSDAIIERGLLENAG